MTAPHAHQGPDFAPKSVRLSRTLIDATISLRGVLRGYGFGVVYPDCDMRNVAFARNAATDWHPQALRVPLRLSVFGIKRLREPQRCNAKFPPPTCVCAYACAHMHAYTVAALQRCTLIYLPEKKEEKKGKPATPCFSSVAGAVAALVKCLKSLNLRGF